jgi:hypothetical protein
MELTTSCKNVRPPTPPALLKVAVNAGRVYLQQHSDGSIPLVQHMTKINCFNHSHPARRPDESIQQYMSLPPTQHEADRNFLGKGCLGANMSRSRMYMQIPADVYGYSYVHAENPCPGINGRPMPADGERTLCTETKGENFRNYGTLQRNGKPY